MLHCSVRYASLDGFRGSTPLAVDVLEGLSVQATGKDRYQLNKTYFLGHVGHVCCKHGCAADRGGLAPDTDLSFGIPWAGVLHQFFEDMFLL